MGFHFAAEKEGVQIILADPALKKTDPKARLKRYGIYNSFNLIAAAFAWKLIHGWK